MHSWTKVNFDLERHPNCSFELRGEPRLRSPYEQNNVSYLCYVILIIMWVFFSNIYIGILWHLLTLLVENMIVFKSILVIISVVLLLIWVNIDITINISTYINIIISNNIHYCVFKLSQKWRWYLSLSILTTPKHFLHCEYIYIIHFFFSIWMWYFDFLCVMTLYLILQHLILSDNIPFITFEL